MNGIIMPLLTIIIITFLWLWLVRQIFEHSDKKRFFLTSITSVISVVVITSIYSIAHTFHLDQYHIIIIYSTIAGIGGLLYLQYQRFSGWLSQSIVWILLAMIGGATGTYSIAARGEESFKWIYIKKFVSGLLGEIILLAIVSGITFGRTENLVYVIQYILNNNTQTEIIGLLQQRGILPLMVHIGSLCISLIIGFQLKEKIPTILARSIALASGIGIHFLFNISQAHKSSLGTLLISIGYLIIISYSLFRSDILYIPPQSTIKKSFTS